MHIPYWVAPAIAAVGYGWLCYSMWKEGVKQNITTYFLWFVIDVLATITSALERSPTALLPLVYAAGCIAVMATIYKTSEIKITWREKLTTAAVVLSIIAWLALGNKAGIVASTLAGCIAGFPLLWDTFARPHESSIKIFLIYLAANVVGVAAGKSWTIEARFYPAVSAAVTLLFVIAAATKLFVPKPEAEE